MSFQQPNGYDSQGWRLPSLQKGMIHQGNTNVNQTPASHQPPRGRAGNVCSSSGRDAKVPPSLQSGGIPNPSPSYLSMSTQPSCILPYPRRILVVLDLNGTLLYRPNKRRPTTFQARPYALRFLKYCIDTFHVVIWSSAREKNVRAMINALVPDQKDRDRIVIVWSRDHFGLTPDDYDKRVQCYKRLSMLWDNEKVARSHPLGFQGVRWSQLDTVLVDDSVEKGRSEPHNLIEIPEFAGHEDTNVPVLPQVHDYLNIICSQANVSSYMRSNPFQLDPNYSLESGL